MSKKPNNKMIGLFVICGIALFVLVISMFISSKFTSSRDAKAVMYFPESVKGLMVGSPVMFKGVAVGKVSDISIVAGLKENRYNIRVVATFSKRGIVVKDKEEGRSVMRHLVAEGLRARLNTQSILTGQLLIELSIMPDAEPPIYRGERKSRLPEIPTVLSPLGKLSNSVQDIHLKETFDKLNTLLDSLNDKVVPEILVLVDSFSAIPPKFKDTPETMQSFNQAMINISAAAKSMKNLTDYLERHPESLLVGKGRRY